MLINPEVMELEELMGVANRLTLEVLRFAGGREKALGKDEYKGYIAGTNSMLMGNYLTTDGKTFEEEMNNLVTCGRIVKPFGEEKKIDE